MKKFHSIAVAVAALSFASNQASAQSESWDYRAFIYLWGAALGGSTTTGQDIDLDFGDVVDALDFGLMGSLEANHGALSLLGDFQYLSLSDDANAAVGPGIPASADAEVDGFVFSGSAGYDFLHSTESQFIAFGGFRYMDLDTTANIAVGNGSQRISGGLSNVDAIVGLRGSNKINEKWSISYYGDIGGGDSDLTWQTALTLDYRINSWDLSFGYRHLAWDVSNSAVLSDLSFSGPFIGAKIPF
ncbi:hypothetical protein ROA7450_04107 [Roseovarius albus]|uniref:Outer membrane protein beta-barrel domain-containing protein n=1 Tax=Roseovarius albus TaxID=1247867 RepID=A0A1X7A8P0_9RHOB|nr:hypothetical protein [Roseovarius albus]SLN73168.1 hypothetical protein ROA7450_04107 [Roseovarius albus]